MTLDDIKDIRIGHNYTACVPCDKINREWLEGSDIPVISIGYSDQKHIAMFDYFKLCLLHVGGFKLRRGDIDIRFNGTYKKLTITFYGIMDWRTVDIVVNALKGFDSLPLKLMVRDDNLTLELSSDEHKTCLASWEDVKI